ncbi:hypothetical protein ACS0TY_019854 [Phlomoides rotata]
MKPNTFGTALGRPKLFVKDFSRTIFKKKPNIRIIHIVEPEIIKTNVENFQELVQRLTGKAAVERKGNTKVLLPLMVPYCSNPGIKTESSGAPTLQDTQKVKKEIEEICDAENQHELLSLLKELDGFLHGMDEFPLLSTQIKIPFGEML